jgi:hypothetical protein
MQLPVIINGARLFALLDSGSTHNFGDIDVAARARIMLQGLRIYIGNGPFTIDSYGLVLRSFHMVLGVQWMESLGCILWDFSKRTMSFVRDGHRLL